MNRKIRVMVIALRPNSFRIINAAREPLRYNRIPLSSHGGDDGTQIPQEGRGAPSIQADEPRHPAERPDPPGAGVQRLRLLGPEHLARAEVVRRSGGYA